MRYYVMEPQDDILLPSPPKGEDAEIVLATDLGRFNEVDYDARSELISERLKLLMEQYMPKYNFRPVVFLDQAKEEQLVFWRFSPPPHTDIEAVYRNDGMVSQITFLNDRLPIIFTTRSPKGIRSIVVRMAVAESALRRGILGLKFTKIGE